MCVFLSACAEFDNCGKNKLTLKNLAMDNFSSSVQPLISASAVSFKAGGPVGMSIIVNQRMGSWESQLVREATR